MKNTMQRSAWGALLAMLLLPWLYAETSGWRRAWLDHESGPWRGGILWL